MLYEYTLKYIDITLLLTELQINSSFVCFNALCASQHFSVMWGRKKMCYLKERISLLRVVTLDTFHSFPCNRLRLSLEVTQTNVY